jgi:hypothetical protein
MFAFQIRVSSRVWNRLLNQAECPRVACNDSICAILLTMILSEKHF